MSTSIDNRIVQMTFDNKQFEAAVKQSMNSLKNLDDSIKNAGDERKSSGMFKGFSKLGKFLNFTDLNASLESIKNRFSTLGIVGMTVIQNLTTGAMNLAKKGLAAVNNALFGGGWQRASNLEQAYFRLNGMVGSAEEVARIMKDVDKAVTGTAFGLDEAAVAASMFAATGMRSGTQMYNTLLAIAGMASTAGVSFQQISDVMVDASAQGVATNDTFTRLALQGIPAAILMADKLGISVEELKKRAKEGKITFEEFAEVMSEKFGANAQQANKTFSGALSNLLTAFKRVGEPFFTSLREGLRDIFNISKEGVNSFGEGLKVLLNNSKRLYKTLSGDIVKAIGKLIDIGTFRKFGYTVESVFIGIKNIFESIGRAFKNVFKTDMVTVIDNIVSKMWELSMSFSSWAQNSSSVETIFTLLFKAFKTGGNVIQHVFDIFSKLKLIFEDVTKAAQPVTQAIMGLSDGFLKFVDNVIKELDKLDIFGRIANLLHKGAGLISSILQSFFEFVSKTLGAFGGTLAESFDKIFEILLAGGVIRTLGSFRKMIEGFTKSIKSIGKLAEEIKSLGESINQIPESITKLLNSIRKSLAQWQKTLKAGELFLIASALLVTALALERLGKLKYENILKGMGAITVTLGILFAAIKAFDLITKKGADLKKAIETPGEAFRELLLSFKRKEDPTEVLIKLSIASLILAQAIKTIGELDTESAIRGVGGIVIVVGLLVAAAKLLSTSEADPKRLQKGMGGLITMAISMRIMASALQALGEMSWEQLDNALAAMTLVLGEVVIFGKLMSKHGKIFTDKTPVVSFITFAISMRIMGSALQKLAEIPWDGMQNALTSMFIVLAEIAGFSKVTDKIGKGSGLQFIAMAAGILILAKALQMMSAIPWEGLNNSMSILIGLLITLSAVMAVASKTGLGAVALLAVAGAVMVLTTALVLLSAVPTDKLAMSLVGLVAALTIVGIAMGVFSLALGPMLTGALALAAVSVSIAIFAASLTGFGVALTVVAGGITAVSAAILALWKVVTGILGEIFNAIKSFVEWISGAFKKDVPDAIDHSKDGLNDAASNLGASMIDSLKKSVLKKLKSFIPSFSKNGKIMGSSLGTSMKGSLNKIPSIVSSGIKNALKKITNAVGNWRSAGGNLIKGVASGIRNGASHLLSAAGDMAKRALNKFKSMLGISSPSKVFMEAASWIPRGAAIGIRKTASELYGEIDEMSNRSVDGLRNAISNALDSSGISDDFNPVITPVLDLSEVEKNANGISSLFGKNTVSTNLAGSIGNTPGMSLADNIDTLTNVIKNFSENQNGFSAPPVFNITVDGAQNPEDFANRLIRRFAMEMRTG